MEYKNENKICQNCKKDFTIESEDFSFYEKIKVPPPTFCFECRMKRRMAWRNERSWHRRVCDATGKPMLSIFRPDAPYKVYEQAYFRSDAWDPMSFGREYDFTRPFFEQFDELLKAVPHPNVVTRNGVNSEYTNYCTDAKNVYWSAGFVRVEDSSYVFGAVTDTKFSVDLYGSNFAEYCYELIDCVKSYNLFFSQNCEGCVDSYYLYDCRNCNNCIGCVGLRSQSYCIFNEQYSKEEYFKKLEELKLNSRAGLSNTQEKFEELKLKVPRKYAVITKAEKAIGDDVLNARFVNQGFYVRDSENVRYSFRVWGNCKDIYDGTIAWDGAELCYDTHSVEAQRVNFSSLIWGGFDIEYSYNCFDCNNIFGCIGLRNKSYCIFNKQYSKEDYLKLRKEIVDQMLKLGEYGEFFPAKYSPFGYNETQAQDYFPLDSERAGAEGFNWAVLEEKNYDITLKNSAIPDILPDLGILEQVIECGHGGKCDDNCPRAFKITLFEYNFYKKFNLPLPTLCPFCRHGERVRKKNPLKLWHRQCMNSGCQNEFETPYSPERPEKVYCESCYNKEVY
ncbi:MAG: hypothetical protein WCT29_01495 [Candidatus Paceibacterota bacterium]|jgi:hypothetical protein